MNCTLRQTVERFIGCALFSLVFFLTVPAQSGVVFNEIMYHPATNEAADEWIELHNPMAVDMDLSGWFLTNGIHFVFPQGTLIRGKAYLVVAFSPATLQTATGLKNIYGPFAGQLSNSGEKLELRNNSGRLIDTLAYGEDAPWPVSPDGSGATLSKIDPNSASAWAENWTGSAQVGGTPGALNFSNDDSKLESLITAGASAKLLIPTNNTLGLDWTQIGFDDAGWIQSSPAIGYDTAAVDFFFLEVMADHPEGYWRLNDTNSSTALDSSGHRRHGTYTGGVTLGAAGALPTGDRAAQFNGTSAFVQLPGTWGGASQLTVEAWVNTSDPITGDFQSIVSTPDGGFAHFQLHTSGNTGAYTSSGFTLLPPPPPTPTGVWRHIVLVAQSGNSRVYVNGVQLGTASSTTFDTITPSILNNPSGSRGVRIGNGHLGGRYFRGRIDEVAVYNTALSAQRVQAHYVAGSLSSYRTLIGTDLKEQMYQQRPGAYLRIPFTVALIQQIDALKLRLRYDDGFLAYLNGKLVASRNAPALPSFDSVAMLDRPKLAALQDEEIDLSAFTGWLRPGVTNVLAIHGLNFDKSDSEFLILPDLLLRQTNRTVPLAMNEVSSASDPLFQVELVNYGQADLNLSGCALVNSALATRPYILADLTLAPREYLTLSETSLGFHPRAGDRLFLFTPGQGAVLDALVVGNFPYGRFPEGTGRWLRPSQSTFGATNRFALHDEIVINEIMYHPPLVTGPAPGGPLLESPEQWIELYNRSDHPVDLTGWQLAQGIDYSFANGETLAPEGYLVVAKDIDYLRTRYPNLRIAGPFIHQLSHRTDSIVLQDASHNLADEVRYFDGGRWPAYADGGGSSLELRDPRADRSQPEAWAASNEAAKSAWRTYTYRGTAAASLGPDAQWKEFVVGLLDAGEVLLDDLRVTENPDSTAVQLLQNGNFSAGTNAWRILGNHHGAVIADPDNPANPVLRLVARGPTDHWSNHAETTLAGSRSIVNGRLYEISFRAKWIAGDRQLNTRLYFNRLARTTRLEVPPLHGTPGARNSRFEANIGPTFNVFSHAPPVPAAGESVTVSAVAEDPDGVDGVTLWWSANGGPWTNLLMTVQTGGRYAANLPGLAASTIVQFYVAAKDSRGAQSFYPAAGPGSRALFKVNDGQARVSLTHNFRILMTAADVSFMHLNSNLMSNDPLGATVVYDEREVFYDVGVRLKGSPYGRPYDQFVSYIVHFQPGHLFRGAYESVHVDRSGRGPVGSPGQDEILIKHIINHAGGLPGEYDDLVWVIAPRPQHTSSALLTPTHYGDDYLDSLYPNGGDSMLFELDGAYYPNRTSNSKPDGPKIVEAGNISYTDIRTLGDNKEAYRWNFVIKNHRDRDDYSRIIDLAKAFSLTGTALDTATQRVIDVNEWMRLFAVLSLVGIGDVYTQGNPHNLWLYVRPHDQKILALPHDNDVSFSRSPSASLTGDNGNLLKVIALPANRRLFYYHFWDLISTTYNTNYMAYWTAHYDNFLSGQNFSSILNYIGQRAKFVSGQLPARFPFILTTQAGQDFLTNRTSVVLQGKAWISVKEIHLAGDPAPLPLTWLTPTNWQTTVPLIMGPNRLTFQAFDYQAQPAGSHTLTVVTTAPGGGLDSDHDGMPDVWEWAYGLNPNFPDAETDADHDGSTNTQEYLAGTDPRDPHSRLTLGVARSADGTMKLTFIAMAGRTYCLQERAPLSNSTWNKLMDIAARSTNRVVETPLSPLGTGQRFYRVVTPSLP